MVFHIKLWITELVPPLSLYLGSFWVVIQTITGFIRARYLTYLKVSWLLVLMALGTGSLWAQYQIPQKKGTEKYQCKGPGCQVPSHNHHYYVPHKNPNRLATLKTRKINHKDLSKVRQKNIEQAHKSLEQHRMKAGKMAHRDLSNKGRNSRPMHHRDMNKATMNPLVIRHRSLENKEQKVMRLAHRNLERYNQKTKEMRHQNLNKTGGPFDLLAHKRMRKEPRSSIKRMARAKYPTIKLRHRDLAQVCYPKYRLRHQSVDGSCDPLYTARHKNLQSKCYPKFAVKHKDLQNKCYPTPKIHHRDLSAECLPKYKIKHENLSTVCYKPEYRVRHQDLNAKCLPTWTIRHKDFEKYTCWELHVQHVPLSKYRVLCDPNIREHPSTMERIGVEVKDIFTRKRLFCKLENRYSGVSQGCVIETSAGVAVVKDYIVKKDTYYPLNLIVEIAKDPHHTNDGEPQVKKLRLSRTETKEIMIRELIKRGKFIWLVRMYPEERKNLPALKELYLNPNGPVNPPPDIINNN